MEKDIPEICGPCPRQEPSMSLDCGVLRQELSMSLNLGVALPGVKLNRRLQQKLTLIIDSIGLQVLTYVQGKHKCVICCSSYVRILRTGTCIVHVQTRTLHDKKDTQLMRESISFKWCPVSHVCALSHPTLRISPSLCRYPHKSHQLGPKLNRRGE